MKPANISKNQWRLYNLFFFLEHFTGMGFSARHLQPRREKLYNRIGGNAGIRERGELKTVDSIARYNGMKDLLADNALREVPTVFRGAARDWPCMNQWSDAFFAEKYGDYTVELIDNIGGVGNDSSYMRTDMATFIHKLKKDKKAYLRVCRIIDEHPELKDDLDLDFIQELAGGISNGDIFYLFMGEAGTNTTMHSEMPVTVFVQVKGSKRWAIYPPEERIFLDPKAQRLAYYHTKANPFYPDYKSYPLLPYGQGYDITTEEGDVLIIPPFYWHYVENLSSSMAVAFKHLDIPLAFKKSFLLSVLFFLRTKPTIIESILYNKKKNYDVQVVMQGRKIKAVE